MKPKVSIVIPVYNGENYIKQAIDSALNQTYNNIEIIVVNDGSTDNTEKIVLEYGNKLKYYKKENGGVSTALNLGIEKMAGDYFSWLSHDDLYEKNKISMQIDEIRNYDQKVILFSNYLVVDANGTTKNTIRLNHNELIKHQEKAVLNGMINGITLLIPKEAFMDCGNFKPELKCTQDYDLWFRMLLKGYHFCHMDSVLTKTREHSKQTSYTSPLMVKEGNELWKRIVNTYPLKNQKKLSGSEYNFYKGMALFLVKHPYKEAIKYCVQKCNALDKAKTAKLRKELRGFKKTCKKRNYNPLILVKKSIISLKSNGIKQTINTIKRFIVGS